MTPPRIELGIYRLSGDHVSHCTTESSGGSSFFHYQLTTLTFSFSSFFLFVSISILFITFIVSFYAYFTQFYSNIPFSLQKNSLILPFVCLRPFSLFYSPSLSNTKPKSIFLSLYNFVNITKTSFEKEKTVFLIFQSNSEFHGSSSNWPTSISIFTRIIHPFFFTSFFLSYIDSLSYSSSFNKLYYVLTFQRSLRPD